MSSSATRTAPLLKHFYNQIRFNGPISVADYMRNCLTHPVHGYYSTRSNIFGHSGDFITAPHISQVFPELLAVWISHFIRTKSLSNFHLVELGPGTGNLVKTLLPSLSRLGTPPSTTTLLEASPKLREIQKSNLVNVDSATKISWVDTLEECVETNEATIFVAQEFLDALPIHVFHRVKPLQDATSWRERLIDIDTSNSEVPRLRFVLSPSVRSSNALLDLVDVKQDTMEICAEGLSVTQRIAKHVAKYGGAGLLIDYGNNEIERPTLRALSKHEHVDVLSKPGENDITADVNFGHLRDAVQGVDGARLWGCVTQGEFLLKLGAAERFRVLGRKVIDEGGDDDVVDNKLRRLQEDYERLVGGGDGMGVTYKVAAVGRVDDGVPFGFDG